VDSPSQLVQFSGVEQAIKTNAHLEALIALQSGGDRSEAASLVGKIVTLVDPRARHDGAGATWRIDTPADAAGVALTVTDASGRIVAEAALPGAPAQFAWDGRQADGAMAAPGVYALTARALARDGSAAAIGVSADHRANAVAFGAGGATVETDIGAAPMAAITRIAAN